MLRIIDGGTVVHGERWRRLGAFEVGEAREAVATAVVSRCLLWTGRHTDAGDVLDDAATLVPVGGGGHVVED